MASEHGAQEKCTVNAQDFECFRLAFGYVQQHRFARIKEAVSSLHLVGRDGNLDPEFRAMIEKVYRAVKQSMAAVEKLDLPGSDEEAVG
jgi:hypothetical protein